MKKVIFSVAVIVMVKFSAYGQNANVANVASTLSEFNVEGITWHAITLKQDKFLAFRKMLIEVMGLKPKSEQEGFALFEFQNGSVLELYLPDKVPGYGYNGGVIFGFRVSDIEAASKALTKAGFEMVCDIVRLKEQKYAYREFRGPDGLIYGLNEQK